MCKYILDSVKKFYKVDSVDVDPTIKIQATDDNINKQIGSWFRGSSERQGARKRNKKDGNVKNNKMSTKEKEIVGNAESNTSETEIDSSSNNNNSQ